MKEFDFIFVVLIYKNSDDLKDFFTTISSNCSNYKVIIVNSYYDDKSMNEIRDISISNNADFINVENKGYSYGNNTGINLALEKYSFKYLVVCNADILVKKWNIDNLLLNEELDVIGPIIKTSTGKNQNPYSIKYLPITEYITYITYKYDLPCLDYIHIIINKILRESFLFLFKKQSANFKKVYGVHGAFLIFSRKFLMNYPKPFYENMFLFNEERYLAFNLRKHSIKPVVTKYIEIYHKEDGSMNKSNVNVFEREKESYKIYYEKVHNIIK